MLQNIVKDSVKKRYFCGFAAKSRNDNSVKKLFNSTARVV